MHPGFLPVETTAHGYMESTHILPTYAHDIPPLNFRNSLHISVQYYVVLQQVCILPYTLIKQIKVPHLFWNIQHSFVTVYVFSSYVILFSTIFMLFLLPIQMWTGTSPSVISDLCSQHNTQWYIRQDYCSAF